MQANVNLKHQPIGVKQAEKASQKPRNRFSILNRAMTRIATFYDDKRLREMGNPYIWTE